MKFIIPYFLVLFFMPLSSLKAQNEQTLLQAIEKEINQTKKADMMYQLGSLYFAQQGYLKATEYLEKALTHIDLPAKAQDIRQKMLLSYIRLENTEKAIAVGETLITQTKQQDDNAYLQTLNALSQYAQKIAKYDLAKKYNQLLWDFYSLKNDTKARAIVSNNLGIISARLNDKKASQKWSEESIQLYQLILQKETNPLEKSLAYINIGATYIKLQQIDLANENFKNALENAGDNPKAQATALNYSAMGKYLEDESAEAIRLALDAKEIAMQTQDSENIIHACQTLKMIYEQQNADKEAKEYAEIALKEQKKRDKQTEKARELLNQKQLEIAKREEEIQSTIAQAAKRDAQIREDKLEKEKREKEIENQKQALTILQRDKDLLQRDKDLANAKIKEQADEQIRTKQLFEIAYQKTETDKQKLLVEKEQTENENKTKDLQTKGRELRYAHEQQKLKDAKLKQEQTIRYLGTGLFFLILGILLYVYRNLRITRKLNNQIQAQKEKETALERSLADMRVRHEKERIARDLHDNIGGQLTYLARTLATSTDEKLNDMVGNAIKELRNTVWAVQQTEVTATELEDKLFNLVAQVETEADIQIKFDLPAHTTFTPENGLNIFRLTQEALQNAVKYSQATVIQISLILNPQNKIALQIADNGAGFDLQKAHKKGHYGLANMQARAELLNASFEMHSQPNQGTTIQVILN